MSQRTTNAARAHVRESRKKSGGSAPRPVPGSRARRESDAGWREKLRYRFDLTLSRGSGALIGWLGLVTLVFVVITGLLLQAAINATGSNDSSNTFLENAWQSLMRTLDPGTVTGDEGWWIRGASLFITIVGIFIFSTLIGLIASVIDRAIEGLRKGRGIVPETNHTLILGWSEKLHTIISELEVANENQRSSCVVILADRDRVEMEDELAARRPAVMAHHAARDFLLGLVGRRRGAMRVVCRSGNPADPGDLAIVEPLASKSTIVLAEPGADSPDAQTTKVLLGLMSFDRELAGMHVLAEFVDPDNATALSEATAGRVLTIVSSDLISRVTAQICRQAGLGAVYQELLDFDGDELYFDANPALAGNTWFQVLQGYATSSPIGVRHADGRVELNPDGDLVLVDGDQVIAISQDDDTLAFAAPPAHVPRAELDLQPAPELAPDHLLMVGWNDLSPRTLGHLARAVPHGSTIDVVVDPDLVTVAHGDLPASDRLTVTLSQADTSRIEPLRDVLGARDYERIVLVGYRGLSPADADSRTLLGLVHARRILDAEHRNSGTAIVAELLEPRSVELGQVANPGDFVVSERLTSLLLAQLSENGDLNAVFAELLDGTGVEIMMRPIARYLDEAGLTGDTARWGDIVRAAAHLGESPIGTMAPGSSVGVGGVTINPSSEDAIDVTPDTQVIVVG